MSKLSITKQDTNAVVAAKLGRIVTAPMERVTLKRAWFVTAYRIVNANDEDMVLPWMTTRQEAIDVAREVGITLESEEVEK